MNFTDIETIRGEVGAMLNRSNVAQTVDPDTKAPISLPLYFRAYVGHTSSGRRPRVTAQDGIRWAQGSDTATLTGIGLRIMEVVESVERDGGIRRLWVDIMDTEGGRQAYRDWWIAGAEGGTPPEEEESKGEGRGVVKAAAPSVPPAVSHELSRVIGELATLVQGMTGITIRALEQSAKSNEAVVMLAHRDGYARGFNDAPTDPDPMIERVGMAALDRLAPILQEGAARKAATSHREAIDRLADDVKGGKVSEQDQADLIARLRAALGR